jgi:hypothetical protein
MSWPRRILTAFRSEVSSTLTVSRNLSTARDYQAAAPRRPFLEPTFHLRKRSLSSVHVLHGGVRADTWADRLDAAAGKPTSAMSRSFPEDDSGKRWRCSPVQEIVESLNDGNHIAYGVSRQAFVQSEALLECLTVA